MDRVFPDAHCELKHNNPFELLVATILSAQCTDERVNKVTPNLFRKFPTPLAMSQACTEEIEKIIQPTGFYKNKAKNIKNCALKLVHNHNSNIPKNLDDLITLDGVGRKTANVVLGVAFQIPNGIVVDTHVKRISQRLGLSKNKTPETIELDLLKIIPKDKWIQLSHQLIFLGRSVCKARNPMCDVCKFSKICPKNDYQ